MEGTSAGSYGDVLVLYKIKHADVENDIWRFVNQTAERDRLMKRRENGDVLPAGSKFPEGFCEKLPMIRWKGTGEQHCAHPSTVVPVGMVIPMNIVLETLQKAKKTMLKLEQASQVLDHLNVA